MGIRTFLTRLRARFAARPDVQAPSEAHPFRSLPVVLDEAHEAEVVPPEAELPDTLQALLRRKRDGRGSTP